MLKSYFDGGGDAPIRNPIVSGDRIFLSGIASNDSTWTEIEDNWRGILIKHCPPAAYIHMVEAVNLRKEFDKSKGWNDDHVAGLINSLISYLSIVPKERYCQFASCVEMKDYRKLSAEGYQMPSPAELCLDACVSTMIPWYFFEYGGLDLEAHYYFDTGEPFEEICSFVWKKNIEDDEKRGSRGAWHHITHVGSAQMRCTPGLQVADMLSWSLNREVASPGKRYAELAIGMKNLMPTRWVVWDEALLRKEFRPMQMRPHEKY